MEEPLLAVADEVPHAWATQIVAHRRHHAQGLVEGKIDAGLVKLDPGPVDVHRVPVRIDPHTQLGDQVPVDRDAARADEVLACSTAADPGCRQEFLQAYAVGIMNVDPDSWLNPCRGEACGLTGFGGATAAALRGAACRGAPARRCASRGGFAGSIESTTRRSVTHARPFSASSSSTSTSGKWGARAGSSPSERRPSRCRK